MGCFHQVVDINFIHSFVAGHKSTHNLCRSLHWGRWSSRRQLLGQKLFKNGLCTLQNRSLLGHIATCTLTTSLGTSMYQLQELKCLSFTQSSRAHIRLIRILCKCDHVSHHRASLVGFLYLFVQYYSFLTMFHDHYFHKLIMELQQYS